MVLPLVALLLGAASLPALVAQDDPVPTLVPPTPAPMADAAGVSDALLAESTIARIQREGKVRVGLLYNLPPFGELNVRGQVAGFDADLARSLVETWGLTFEPVQITRQIALDALRNGDVDMVIAAQVHRRELDGMVEFSQTYFPTAQTMLVRADDGAAVLADMTGRRVGVVMGYPGEQAAAIWQQRSGISVTVTTYLTLDRAVVALLVGEVDGVVENRVQLTRVVPDLSQVRLLDEPVSPEPYAVVVRRQDVNFRNLVNRTLQYLRKTGRLNEIHQTYFEGANYPENALPLWANLGEEAPTPAQFGGDVPYPAQYIVPRLQASRVVRVAGFADLQADSPDSEKNLDAVNRALVEAMAARWGAAVEFIPNSAANAVDLVAAGQADLAVGVPLDWTLTDRVDLTGFYLLHGERLMVEQNAPYETFNDIRGRWVGVFASEPGAADRVNALAETVNTSVRIFTILREQDAAFNMLVEENADVIFGDSLKLIPQLEANPGLMRITTRGEAPDPWYSRTYRALAVPRNDLDFRLLVDYTLQELARDGVWRSLVSAMMLPEDIPALEIWPGPSSYLGFNLDEALAG
ncbi:MAG: transporter substrate-binding domain-containing protein [Chloroflexi bacterium]|nr:transporter substrate-binding domain-containing protein [Chloroflexota bacterium]